MRQSCVRWESICLTVYEPSAVQQLPDGNLLIAEDEPNHAFSIVSIDKTGRFVEDEALIPRDYRFQTPSQRLGGFGARR